MGKNYPLKILMLVTLLSPYVLNTMTPVAYAEEATETSENQETKDSTTETEKEGSTFIPEATTTIETSTQSIETTSTSSSTETANTSSSSNESIKAEKKLKSTTKVSRTVTPLNQEINYSYAYSTIYEDELTYYFNVNGGLISPQLKIVTNGKDTILIDLDISNKNSHTFSEKEISDLAKNIDGTSNVYLLQAGKDDYQFGN